MSLRKAMIYAHLGLAALFMPLLLMMPFTGAMYLWDFKGSETKTAAFTIAGSVPEEKTAQEAFFRDQFRKQNINFDFEYVRATKTDYIFRPTTKVHYVATKLDDGSLSVSKIEPSLLKRMIELHKGHGPQIMRIFESIFGISLILTTLSGLWLAWTVKPYRKVTLISFGAGVAILALCMI